tara:strand:- start:347 stop:547 length:201 start_codon:yes stop_codon:yes gene_type:complete
MPIEIKSYDKNNNPVYRVVGVKHTKKWRMQAHKESFEKNGNGWWIFVGVAQYKNKNNWIEQFRKGD